MRRSQAAAAEVGTEKQRRVKVRFSFDAENEDELSLSEGDVVVVLGEEGDWWDGELRGRRGIFPKNYAGDAF